jgi:hypothetical protein
MNQGLAHRHAYAIGRLSHFWTTDRSLSVFLGLLLVAVFLLAPLAEQEDMLYASVGFSVLLLSGVGLVAKNRMTRGLVTGSALVTLVIHWIQHVVPGTGLASLIALSSMGFLALLAGLVFVEVLKKGLITLHRVQGAGGRLSAVRINLGLCV